MRQTKFRGQRVDNKQWVYGYYMTSSPEFHTGLKHYIVCDNNINSYCGRDFIEVIPETVSYYTGITERNGKNIFEHDIVKFHYFYASLGENLGVQESEHELTGIVTWGEYGWAITAIKGHHWEGYTGYAAGKGESSIMELYAMNQSGLHEESFEVIGNKFDNPELLNL